MGDFIRTYGKRLLFIPPVVLGGLVFAFAVGSRGGPERSPAVEAAVTVRVIAVPEVTLVPRALGYGVVQPGTVWEAVAEVGGQVVWTHPQLKKGAILAKGAVLLRIDPRQYELAVAQTEANSRQVEAQLAELKVKEANTRSLLKIEKRSLELLRKNLERKNQLLNRKAVSQAAVDNEERNVLVGRQSVQSLKNSLNLIPAERHTLEAELALYQAQLGKARLDLARTTITAPFDSRIAEVNVEMTQYAAQGKVLAVADGIGVSEVSAQVPIGGLNNLMSSAGDIPAHMGTLMDNLPELLGFSAVVRLRSGNINAEWKARFTRISDTIDPKTRTVGVIVAVDDPYRHVVHGVRLPLAKNMFVEVELAGRPRPNQVVIPRSALHSGRVYIVNGEDRLEKRKVGIAFKQTNFANMESGLAAGERVVISDLIPAVDGMKLAPFLDEAAARALIDEAEGRSPVR